MGSRLFQNGIPVEGEADDDVLATPFTQEMFLNGFNLEPFVNELARIRHSMKCLQQKHEVKKSKLWPQYEQEIESTRRKYDLFLKIEDATFKKDKAFLEELRQKVERGISVDKEFRARFLQTMEADALHEVQVSCQDISTIPFWVRFLPKIRSKDSKWSPFWTLLLPKVWSNNSTVAPFWFLNLAQISGVTMWDTQVLVPDSH
ncbi:uncharacterized protein LOC144571637 isoform X1 [Carex rostrata]